MLSLFLELISGDAEITDILLRVFALAVVIIICFPIHESAHAWMAGKLGDETGRLSGRISMNPMAHLSLFGTICIILFGVGYAKPVPVNIRNFPVKKRKRNFALTALAGPVSNLIIAVVALVFANCFAVIWHLRESAFTSIGTGLFSVVAQINIALAVFNLLPIPPLDGSRIWTMLLPDRIYYKFLEYERYSMYVLMGLLILFNRIGFSPVGVLTTIVYNAFDFIVGLPFDLLLKAIM